MKLWNWNKLSDRNFEVFKLIFDKILTLIILSVMAYFINVMLKDRETENVKNQFFAAKRAEVTFEIIEYLQKTIDSFYMADKSLIKMQELLKDCPSFSKDLYLINSKVVANAFKKMKYRSDLSLKGSIYLDKSISKKFDYVLNLLFEDESIRDIDAAIKLAEKLKLNKMEVHEFCWGQENFLYKLRQYTDKSKVNPEFSILKYMLIAHLGPEVHPNNIYFNATK